MIPNSFDLDTCKEYIGDARSRVIEGKARTDAETDQYSPPKRRESSTYIGQVTENMEDIIYLNAFNKRKARIERKAKL